MTSDPPDHARLVIAARRGDAEAFGELYRRFGRFVHALLLARLPPDEVADLTQDVFAQAWTRLHTLREPAAFGPWLAAIARRRAADHLRARHLHVELDDTVSAPETQTAAMEEPAKRCRLPLPLSAGGEARPPGSRWVGRCSWGLENRHAWTSRGSASWTCGPGRISPCAPRHRTAIESS